MSPRKRTNPKTGVQKKSDSRAEFRSFGFSDEEADIYLKGAPEEVAPSNELLILRRYTSELPFEIIVFSPLELPSHGLHPYTRAVKCRRLGGATGFPPTFTEGFTSVATLLNLADLKEWAFGAAVESETLQTMWSNLWADCCLPWTADQVIWEHAGKFIKGPQEVTVSLTSGEKARLIIALFEHYWNANGVRPNDQYYNVREITGTTKATFNLGNFQKLSRSLAIRPLTRASFGLRYTLFVQGFKHWLAP